MAKHIYKYAMPMPFSSGVVELPDGFKFVHVAMQGREIMGWAEVDPSAKAWGRPFCTLPTGAAVPDRQDHIGTVLDGIYVWHVYGARS